MPQITNSLDENEHSVHAAHSDQTEAAAHGESASDASIVLSFVAAESIYYHASADLNPWLKKINKLLINLAYHKKLNCLAQQWH